MKKNLKRVGVQLVSVALVSLLIALLQPTAELMTFIVVPALSALTVWLSGALIKGRCNCLLNDSVFTSFFTTFTCSYAATAIMLLSGITCIFPYSLFVFVGAFAGFYLPVAVRVASH